MTPLAQKMFRAHIANRQRGHGGTPKAFHFCRGHVRRLSSGVVTRVRAHWRGDPSLGVCQADYRVAA